MNQIHNYPSKFIKHKFTNNIFCIYVYMYMCMYVYI